MIFSSEKRFFFTLTLRMELSLFDFVRLCFGQFFLGGTPILMAVCPSIRDFLFCGS